MLATFARYNLVQVLAYGLDYGIFALVVRLDPEALLAANILSKLAAGLFAFVLHKHVTFRKPGSGRAAAEAVLYFALLGLNTALASGLLMLLAALLPPLLAKPVADVLCMLVTFTATKLLVFKDYGPVARPRR